MLNETSEHSAASATSSNASAPQQQQAQQQQQQHHHGHSGISQYSPISTLQKQYSGSHIHIFCKTNANCLLHGGVETILRQRRQQQRGGSNNQQSMSTASSNFVETTSESTDGGAPPNRARLNSTDSDAASSVASGASDPFSFLGQPEQPAATTTDNNTTNMKKGPNLGRFLKKVAKSTTNTLERGMHSLAVRADGGKNPDLLAVGLYDAATGRHLLSLTESLPLPSNETTRLAGLSFGIPLAVPLQSKNNTSFVIKLWIRSGAALLGKAARNYLIGSSAPLHADQLQRSLQAAAAASNNSNHTLLNVTLQSQTVVDGQLQLLVTADGKFPALCGRGWSLADPMAGPQPAVYQQQQSLQQQQVCRRPLHNLALHQVYRLDHNNNNNNTSGAAVLATTTTTHLIATERTVESALVLPVATAVAQHAAAASQVSLQQATAVCQQVAHDRHDVAPPSSTHTGGDGSSAAAAYCEYALCQVSAGALQILTNYDHAGGAAAATAMMPATATTTATVLTTWQRPDSIFESELAAPVALPVVSLPPNSPGVPFETVHSVSFFPKPVRTGILPGILQHQAMPPAGFMLGNVRLQITMPAGKSAAAAAHPSTTGVVPENPFEPPVAHTAGGGGGALPAAVQQQQDQIWECVISLDAVMSQHSAGASMQLQADDVFALQAPNVPTVHPVYNAVGVQVAQIALVVSVGMEQQQGVAAVAATPAAAATGGGGLVALVGLSSDAHNSPQADILPSLDYNDYDVAASCDDATTQQQQHTTTYTDENRERRRQQLATMGYFMSHGYLEQHVQQVRTADALHWNERAQRYRAAIQSGLATNSGTNTTPPTAEWTPSHEDKTPRPFRPSSSRSEVLLAGIPFNVHTASLSLDVLDPTHQQQQQVPPPGAVFYNMTCGAPADHARGFSNVFHKKDPNAPNVGLNSPVGPVSGGLRRLEAKRMELIGLVSNLQTMLTMSIANYFVEKRQINRIQASHHVPPRHAELADLRWKLFEAVQSLHHVTWHCAMRRSISFSQALGIATSSFLASLSDPAKCSSTWPAVWARHGYLVSFEGLLSAAGKELGMIEDASVGISMLSMVQIVIVADNGSFDPAAPSATMNPSAVVPVPGSPYIKWIQLLHQPQPPLSGQQQTPAGPSFTLQIGMVQSYYDQRIPEALKNGTPVRFYSLLFEVGVDIHQWGAHAGSNMKTSFQMNLQNSTGSNANNPETKEVPVTSVGGGLLDDEDDDVGPTDDDVLVQLNSEAFQKLNTYAHAIFPQQQQPAGAAKTTHPMLATLYQHIVSSAGKINHDIVDEAATLAQQLGGGGVVFCKSGKDRTAMHVTYKQAQFASRFRKQQQQAAAGGAATTNAAGPQVAVPTTTDGGDGDVPTDTTLDDATLMRVYGTRLPICEKNVGQALYAFNTLQVKFMPDALKPPINTLAGFLKGGKVFTGGGIES